MIDQLLNGLIAGSIAGGVLLLVALLMPRKHCPNCEYKLPRFRSPQSGKQAMQGGWTCPNCGAEIDRRGHLIEKGAGKKAKALGAREAIKWAKEHQWDKFVESGVAALKPLTTVLEGADTESDEYDDMMVRADAAHALGEIALQASDMALRIRAVEPLIAALGDPRWKVRYAATFGMTIVGTQLDDIDLCERAVDPLIICLKDEHKDVRANAAEALGEIGAWLKDPHRERVAKELATALADTNTYVRGVVTSALTKTGKPSIRMLITALTDGRSFVRINAADGLGKVNDEQAVVALIGALKDSVPDVRWHVTRALAKIAPALRDSQSGTQIKQALVTATQDQYELVRQAAEKALQELGWQAAVLDQGQPTPIGQRAKTEIDHATASFTLFEKGVLSYEDKLTNCEYPARRLFITPDGSLITYIAYSKENAEADVKVFDRKEKKLVQELKVTLPPKTTEIAFRPDLGIMVTASDYRSEGNLLQIFHVDSGKKILDISLDYPALGLAISPNGKIAAAIWMNWKVSSWDLSTGQMIMHGSHPDYGRTIGFTPDSRRIVSLSKDWTLKVWDIASQACISTWEGEPDQYETYLSQDCQYAVVAKRDTGAVAMEVSTGTTVATWKPEGSIQSLYAARNGSLVVWVSTNEGLKAWHVQGQKYVQTLPDSYLPAIPLDGSCITVMQKGNTITIWEANCISDVCPVSLPMTLKDEGEEGESNNLWLDSLIPEDKAMASDLIDLADDDPDVRYRACDVLDQKRYDDDVLLSGLSRIEAEIPSDDVLTRVRLYCGLGVWLGGNIYTRPKGIELIRQAIELSPDMALPHALLGTLLMGDSSNVYLERGTSSFRQHAGLSDRELEFLSRDFHEQAQKELESAIRLNPNDPTPYYVFCKSQFLEFSQLNKYYLQGVQRDKTHSPEFGGSHWSFATKAAKFNQRHDATNAFIRAMLVSPQQYYEGTGSVRPREGLALSCWQTARQQVSSYQADTERLGELWLVGQAVESSSLSQPVEKIIPEVGTPQRFQERFTPQEWETLQLAFIWVFRMTFGIIRKSDCLTLDEKVMAALGMVIVRAPELENGLAREVVLSLSGRFESIWMRCLDDPQLPHEALKPVAQLLQDRVSSEEARGFKQAILMMTREIATTSGRKSQDAAVVMPATILYPEASADEILSEVGMTTSRSIYKQPSDSATMPPQVSEKSKTTTELPGGERYSRTGQQKKNNLLKYALGVLALSVICVTLGLFVLSTRKSPPISREAKPSEQPTATAHQEQVAASPDPTSTPLLEDSAFTVTTEVEVPTAISTSTPTHRPKPTSTPDPAMIYWDDFDGPPQWPTLTDQYSSRYYANGKYIIKVGKDMGVNYQSVLSTKFGPSYNGWSVTTQHVTTAAIEVEAQLLSDGPRYIAYGVIFNYYDANNFMFVEITPEGAWDLVQNINGEYYDLITFRESPAINRHSETNRLRVEISNTQIKFYVNDRLLTVFDKISGGGNVGLWVTCTEGGDGFVEVAFDNFTITRLSGTAP